MTNELRGGLEGDDLKVALVVARFNHLVTTRLLDGAKAALSDNGVRDQDITVVYVPGSFEIPIVAKRLATSSRFDSVVCLGAVIRGETDHYEYIASEAARGISRTSQETGIPIVFGILTTDTIEQAIERAGGKNRQYNKQARYTSKPNHPDDSGEGQGNTGYSAGLTAIEMANLIKTIDSI